MADSASNPSIHILKDGATDTASYTYEVKLFRNGNDEDDENPLGTTQLSITGNQDGTISFENVSLEVGSYRVQVKEIPEQGDPPRLAVSDTVESHQMFNGDSVPVLPSGYYHVTFTNVHEKRRSWASNRQPDHHQAAQRQLSRQRMDTDLPLHDHWPQFP